MDQLVTFLWLCVAYWCALMLTWLVCLVAMYVRAHERWVAQKLAQMRRGINLMGEEEEEDEGHG